MAEILKVEDLHVHTDSGHVVVFGLESYLFGVHKPKFLRQLVDQKGGVIVAAHPYRRRFLAEPAQQPESRAEMLDRAAGDEFFRYCDAIEGINGRGTDAENCFSHDLGKRLELKSTGGSDAHRIEQLGTAATRFQKKVEGLADLIEEIRTGRICGVALTSDEKTATSGHSVTDGVP